MLTGEPTLDRLLKATSRAFYLSLRILPPEIRKPISIAYLMARTADTIADTQNIELHVKLKSLEAIKMALNSGECLINPDDLFRSDEKTHLSLPEYPLLSSIPLTLQAIEVLEPNNSSLVKEVLATLIQGMEMDLKCFGKAMSKNKIASLRNPDEVDLYTFLVAGCVGPFWTEVTFTNTPELKDRDIKNISSLGVDFGKALQMTNILRDCPSDIRAGKCYLAKKELADLCLTPDDLLNRSASIKVKRLLINQVNKTIDLYDSAEQYVLSIPPNCRRLRLAALWPLLIGLGTLEALVLENSWMHSEKPAKVSRLWVYKMIIKSLFIVSSDYSIKFWIKQLRASVGKGLLI